MKRPIIIALAAMLIFAVMTILPAYAEDAPTTDSETTAVETQAETQSEDEAGLSLRDTKAVASAAMVGAAAVAGAVCMAWAITSAIKGIARQPEADEKIRTNLMLGLVFIETAIIYALIIAILIIFVL